jgi:hypothetical protein
MNSDDYNQKHPLVKPHVNLLENKGDGAQKSHRDKQKKWIYYIEERRKEVAQMLAQGHTETEIAQIRTYKYHLQRCQSFETIVTTVCI